MSPRQPLRDLIAICALLPMFFASLNVQFLLLYLFPLTLGAFVGIALPFTPFLAVPTILTVLAYRIYFRRSKASGWRRYLSVSALMFFTFLLSAEIYKDALIFIYTVRSPYDCLHMHTFAGSIHRMGKYAPDHARIIVNGTPYFWSYSERTFVRGAPAPWYDCKSSLLAF